jgi:hypothetical protein
MIDVLKLPQLPYTRPGASLSPASRIILLHKLRIPWDLPMIVTPIEGEQNDSDKVDELEMLPNLHTGCCDVTPTMFPGRGLLPP